LGRGQKLEELMAWNAGDEEIGCHVGVVSPLQDRVLGFARFALIFAMQKADLGGGR
jgi:hypothetical protein